MAQQQWSASRRRRRSGIAVVAALALGAAIATPLVTASAATLSTSKFEIDTDANLKVDTSGNIDWLDAGALRITPRTDDPSGSGDSAFSNGTKEDSAVPTLDNGGIPPNKSDLRKFGVYQETVGVKSYLHLFWTRVQDPSGTTNMDFEFNKSRTTANLPAGSPQIVPVRTAGDLLLTYDLSRGGTVATVMKRTWTGSAWGPATDLTTTGQAYGTINTSAIPAADAGGLNDGSGLSPRTFGEASIDLSAVFTGPDCQSFGSAYLKSRSSDSFTAALKDFIPPQSISVTNCGSVKINKTDPNGALGGAEFTLYKDVAPVKADQANQNAAGAEDKTTANAVGTCTSLSVATLTQPVGECLISDVPLGNYWLVETLVPANHNGAADTYVQVATPGQQIALTINNPLQPGSVSITKVDDAGAALGGVVFTLYNDLGTVGGTRQATNIDTITNPLRSCTTSAVNDATKGKCTITGVPIGNYWLVETTPTGYATVADQQVQITTGGQVVPLTITNNRQFKVITLVCRMSDGPAVVQGQVTYDKGTTTAQNTATTVSGATAATICSLPGSTTVIKSQSPVGASVTIP